MFNRYIEHRLDKIHQEVKESQAFIEGNRKLEDLKNRLNHALTYPADSTFKEREKGKAGD